MDLLGDIGTADQLTSARTENAVLQQKVKELTQRVHVLAVENESLKAEVEIYRKEAALPNFSTLALGKSEDTSEMMVEEVDDSHFVRSGNGTYTNRNDVTLPNLHGQANPLCCALSMDDAVLATGGADSCISLATWGAVYNPNTTEESVVNAAYRIKCDAPIITTSFSPLLRNVFAAGSIDGSVRLCSYETQVGGGMEVHVVQSDVRHSKYVRAVVWNPTSPILATASADGNVHIYKVERDMMDFSKYTLQKKESLHLPGSVEAMTFVGNELFCYARGTPYLHYFDLDKDMAQRKVNLNTADSYKATGGFDEHVSFAVMHLQAYSDRYLAAATDSARNIIIEASTGKIIRNLYGHSNDGYSQPKLAWSQNGQYLLGNSQTESCVCVWDIASSQIVSRLEGHKSPIRDLYSSPNTDLLVTTTFDKQTKLWFAPL